MPIEKNSRVAEKLNKYFINVGPNLAGRMQNTFKIFEDFLFTVQKNIETGTSLLKNLKSFLIQ